MNLNGNLITLVGDRKLLSSSANRDRKSFSITAFDITRDLDITVNLNHMQLVALIQFWHREVQK